MVYVLLAFSSEFSLTVVFTSLVLFGICFWALFSGLSGFGFGYYGPLSLSFPGFFRLLGTFFPGLG
jgi:hypothetical protein